MKRKSLSQGAYFQRIELEAEVGIEPTHSGFKTRSWKLLASKLGRCGVVVDGIWQFRSDGEYTFDDQATALHRLLPTSDSALA